MQDDLACPGGMTAGGRAMAEVHGWALVRVGLQELMVQGDANQHKASVVVANA